MNIKSFSPIRRKETGLDESMGLDEAKFPTLRKKDNLYKMFKVAAKAIGANPTALVSSERTAFYEEPPYNFEQIMQAIDTDSYCQQAFNKYQELIWKSGWEIESENEEALFYLKKRIALMEISMNRSFESLLKEVGDHLVKFHNAFVVKHRSDLSAYISQPIDTATNKNPITGYYLIPPESVRVKRNSNNIPIKYMQVIDGSTGFGQSSQRSRDPEWPAKDVIHLYKNRKTGRIFGTPFIIAALDDVIALRQVEQDVQNLIHRELIPIFKYMLTDVDQDDPDSDLVTQIIEQLEDMRTEGSLFLPPGHDVQVVGAEGSALDIGPYLDHFKERVAIGLGVFPHHLGMVSFAGANRDMTDRLDQNLYEKVKNYQRDIEQAVTFHIFNELLLDGGFDPFGNLSGSESDQCFFKFKEIDLDSSIKRETHVMNKLNNGVIDIHEARIELGYLPDLEIENTVPAIQAKIAMKYNPNQGPEQPSNSTSSDKQSSSTGGRSNPPNNKKLTGNIIKPQNQHGRSLSPGIRHEHDDILEEDESDFVDLYLEYLKDDE